MARAVYDLAKARAARDAGIARVSRKWWQALARSAARFYVPYDVELIGEDIARIIRARGVPPPHHYGAWGALTRSLADGKHKLLVRVGDYRSPQKVKSHARKTQVYVRLHEPW